MFEVLSGFRLHSCSTLIVVTSSRGDGSVRIASCEDNLRFAGESFQKAWTPEMNDGDDVSNRLPHQAGGIRIPSGLPGN